MGKDWRRLDDNITEPRMHFAVEEMLLRRVDTNRAPNTLRLRKVVPSVFIGIYQDPAEEVNLKYCRENNIPVIRRMNPGGAVYQDEGTFCYSLFFRKKKHFSELNIKKSFQLYDLMGEAVIKTCREFGIESEKSGMNDVSVKGRKIYGSAQMELYAGMVHSGTFLVNVDKNKLRKALTPAELKFKDKKYSSVGQRIVNLQDLINQPIEVEDVMNRLVNNIAGILKVEFKRGALTTAEKEEASYLYREKYSLRRWTYKKSAARSSSVAIKGLSGVVILSADIEDEIIKKASIKGDFLVADQRELNNVIGFLSNKSIPDSINIIDNSNLENHLRNDLKKLLQMIEK